MGINSISCCVQSMYLRRFHDCLLVNKLAPRSKVAFNVTGVIVSMSATFVTFPFLHCFKYCHT